MEINLKGKLALVTGASKGLGRAIALRFGESGADVAVNFNTDRTGGESVAERIREMGRESIAIQADVSVADQVEAMIETVEKRFGARFDILVNNAGIGMHKAVFHMTNNEWDQIIDTNLKGAFHVSRAFANKMIKNGTGGRIIGIASGAGHSGRPGHAHYCASKAGLRLFCKTLAIELAPYAINVNTISVGFVEVGKYDTPERRPIKEDILRRILLRRPGKPEDIANMAVFLASEQASWITAADFRVDGGESAGRVPLGD